MRGTGQKMDPITNFVLRYSHHFKKLTTLFRYIELLTLTALAFWSSAHLPTAAKSSSDLICHVIIPIVLGPRFLFLLSNVIIVSLLFLSRQSSAADSTATTDVAAFAPPPNDEVPVFEDKEVVCVVERNEKQHVRKTCRRTRSSLMVEKKKRSPELRRAETDVKKVKEEEEEEFRRAVEAFIEKQRNFILSEEINNANINISPNLALVESKDVII